MPTIIKNRVWKSEGGAGREGKYYYGMFTNEKLYCIPRKKCFVLRG
jgi:hypothetical protein